jgi:hypothetical protein
VPLARIAAVPGIPEQAPEIDRRAVRCSRRAQFCGVRGWRAEPKAGGPCCQSRMELRPRMTINGSAARTTEAFLSS